MHRITSHPSPQQPSYRGPAQHKPTQRLHSKHVPSQPNIPPRALPAHDTSPPYSRGKSKPDQPMLIDSFNLSICTGEVRACSVPAAD